MQFIFFPYFGTGLIDWLMRGFHQILFYLYAIKLFQAVQGTTKSKSVFLYRYLHGFIPFK